MAEYNVDAIHSEYKPQHFCLGQTDDPDAKKLKDLLLQNGIPPHYFSDDSDYLYVRVNHSGLSCRRVFINSGYERQYLVHYDKIIAQRSIDFTYNLDDRLKPTEIIKSTKTESFPFNELDLFKYALNTRKTQLAIQFHTIHAKKRQDEFFQCCRSTKITGKENFDQIIAHACSDSNRTNTICQKLGWVNRKHSQHPLYTVIPYTDIETFRNDISIAVNNNGIERQRFISINWMDEDGNFTDNAPLSIQPQVNNANLVSI